MTSQALLPKATFPSVSPQVILAALLALSPSSTCSTRSRFAQGIISALSKAGIAISASTYYEWIALVEIITAQRADKKTGKFVATLGSRKFVDPAARPGL